MTPPHRVMIVDDDETICRSLARIFRARGYEVVTAGDGMSAIRQADEFLPELLLLDIRMPGIDGVETFRRIRRRHPRVTGVLMTAYASQNSVDEARDSGVLKILSKPLDLQGLGETVAHALRSAPVLIVDDDEPLLASIRRLLNARGIDVVTVTTFADAIAELRRRPDRVVIADVVLGDGFGYELLDEVNDREMVRPFILMSGRIDREQLEREGRLPGSATWMEKPLDMNALIGQLQRSDERGG